MRFQRDNQKREEILEGLDDYDREYDYDDWGCECSDCTGHWWSDDNWDWYTEGQFEGQPLIDQLELPLDSNSRNRYQDNGIGPFEDYTQVESKMAFKSFSRLGRIRWNNRGDTLATEPTHRAA